MNVPDFPPSLRTATPAEGQALADRLAAAVLAAGPDRSSMPGQLRTDATRPAPEFVAAIYFHAIAIANAGWRATAPGRD
jgi:hypothetical protein